PSPLGISTLAGIGAGVGLAVTRGSDSAVTNTNNTNNTTNTGNTGNTLTYQSVAKQYQVVTTVQGRPQCVIQNGGGTLVLGGTQTASTAILTLSSGTYTLTGSATVQTTSVLFTLNGSGSNSFLGNYNATLTGQIVNGSMSGTVNFVGNPCGQAVL